MSDGLDKVSIFGVHDIIQQECSSMNKLWFSANNTFYFYPVGRQELKQIFEDEGLEWNEANLAKWLIKTIIFLQKEEVRNMPIDRRMVKSIVKENAT